MKTAPKVALLSLAAAAGLAIALALALSEDEHHNADGRAMAVKEGLHSIARGVRRWAAAHDAVYPLPSRVTEQDLGTVDEWPANPYSGRPMVQGAAPGDFAYQRGADGRTFRLAAFGEDGTLVLVISQ